MMRNSTPLALVLSAALVASPAAAQRKPSTAPPSEAAGQPTRTLDSEGERPWANGVPREKQDAAYALFRAGNALLKESVFLPAIEKYRQALEQWDHPAIHYNLALAMMNLDQPIEVHEQLVQAMRYGPEPLELEKFEYARNYKTLIEKQLARVVITCESPGATVTLDGKTLFVAPGRYEGLVRPGAHSIIATQPGYAPTDMSRTLMPGETADLQLKMYSADELIRYRTRWAVWMPWAVVGSGLAVAAGGSLLHLQARDSYTAFDSRIVECGGCKPEGEVQGLRTGGDLQQQLAFGGYALGGAAVVTGAVLLLLNQPQPYSIEPGQASEEKVSVTPLLGGGTGGLLTTFRF